MLRKTACALAGLSISIAFVACNSDTEAFTDPTLAYSAMVTNFSLAANTSVLSGLDSVYFSIDQANLQIFNADSLPVGTSLKKMVPVITTAGASIIEVIQPRVGQTDTVYNYIENSTDTVDFSQGPVKLRIVALDGVASSTYTIKINVHNMVPDTLVWTRLERSNLPSNLGGVNQQKTTEGMSEFWCLTRYGSEYCIAHTDNPSGAWQYIKPNFGISPNVESFTGTDDALYVLNENGSAYKSTDGVNWSLLQKRFDWLYGNYGNQLIGSVKTNGKWYIMSYPSETQFEAPANFPVRESSQSVTHLFEMASTPQLILVGGEKADGTLTNTAWGYDGTSWAQISKTPIPYNIKNMSLAPYFSVRTSTTTWRTTTSSVLLAMNGELADGTLNDTVYLSRDFGMNWSVADSLMVTPAAVPARTKAQLLGYSATMNVSQQKVRGFDDGGNWDIIFQRPEGTGLVKPMATTPITSWDCPYLYLFGGVAQDGQTYNTVYRGVINRFTFVPLQ